MYYKIGRALQIAALLALPLAMILELTGAMGRAFGLSQLLIALVFGVCLFGLGSVIQGYRRP